MAQGNFISYYRVSTERQGRSGLGLEAQAAAVRAYLNGGSWELVQEFTEVESGKNNDRPQLAAALKHCKLTGSKLVIAKLDRLSRDAHFLLGLQKAGVPFVCADMPEANELTVGIMALVAEQERRAISIRTKEALAAAKARGVKLGSPKGAMHLRGRYQPQAVEANREKANNFATEVLDTVQSIRTEGKTSLRAIANELNERKVQAPRGGTWHAMTVKRILERLEK